MRFLFITLICIIVIGCAGNSNQEDRKNFYKAFDAGNLSEAKSLLCNLEGKDLYQCAEALIKEYIAVGDVQSAISVYERNTPNHCTTYQMKFKSLHSHDDYENRVTQMLYDALINADDFETAWNYHPLDYDDPNYAGNGGCYFSYISDVIIHLCQQERQIEAQQFLDKHSLWFLKNVDNGEWGKSYPNYSYDKVVRDLQYIIINEEY